MKVLIYNNSLVTPISLNDVVIAKDTVNGNKPNLIISKYCPPSLKVSKSLEYKEMIKSPNKEKIIYPKIDNIMAPCILYLNVIFNLL